MTDVSALTFDQLTTGLRAWARGLYPLEAAVEVLLAHRGWLHRADFRRATLRISDGRPSCVGIDWAAAAQFAGRAPASGSEIAMLRIAISIAGREIYRPLGDLLSGLDAANITIVLNAIAHTAGWHERGTVALITGGFDALTPA
ncbi:hypothetical protein [Pengzhenrongella sp.]|uniref:hypothetical protein n=1 Tax=Pengzhenrongella sp. TaxID=2888820 RepID=UPI002F930010